MVPFKPVYGFFLWLEGNCDAAYRFSPPCDNSATLCGVGVFRSRSGDRLFRAFAETNFHPCLSAYLPAFALAAAGPSVFDGDRTPFHADDLPIETRVII
jgi:hypothetical protein